MAKSQETLLQEVVGQLRMLNKSSVRDRLRDAEDAKRAEKMQAIGEETSEQGEIAISASTDFQRRYLAAQAGSLTDAALQDAPKGVLQKVIAKSSDKISQFTKDNLRYVKMMRWEQLQKIRYDIKGDTKKEAEAEERRREEEHFLEGFIREQTKFLRGFVIRKERWEETKSVWKETWAKFKWGVIFATLSAVYLAYEGVNFWSIKIGAEVEKILQKSKAWKTSIASIGGQFTKLRTSIMAWFGYDKAGKPIFKKVDGQWKAIKWAGINASIGERIASIKTAVYRWAGLGPDGKKLGNTFERGGKGKSAKIGLGRNLAAGTFKNITKSIGRILSPMFRMSAAITNFFAGATGQVITKGLKAIGAGVGLIAASPFVKMLGKILWPISMFFALFNAFGSAKEEYANEDSNWFTIMGAGVGGFFGYVIGALVDLVKDGLIWIIKKAFGYETDESGKILKGQGFIGDMLGNAQEFSFQDLITDVITNAYRMVSDVVSFIVGLFTGASYDTEAWQWITNIPSKIIEWIKGYIPNWLKKALGMKIDGAEEGTPEYKEQMMDWTKGKGKTAWSELYALSGIDPTKYSRGVSDQKALESERNAWLAIEKNQEALEMAYARQLKWDEFLAVRQQSEEEFLAQRIKYTNEVGKQVYLNESTIFNYYQQQFQTITEELNARIGD